MRCALPPAPVERSYPWRAGSGRIRDRESPETRAAAGAGSGGWQWPRAVVWRSFRTSIAVIAKEAWNGFAARSLLSRLLWLQPELVRQRLRRGLRGLGQVGDIQAVIVAAPLALLQNCQRYLLERQIRVGVCLAAKGRAADQQAALAAHFFTDCSKVAAGKGLRRHVDKIGLGRVPVLPVDLFAGRVSEAHQLAHGLGQHGGVVLLADDKIAKAVFFEQRRRKPVVAEAAAALPVHRLGDAAGVLAVDDLLEARNDVRVAVLAQFDHNPAAAHLVGDCASRTRAGERVEDDVAGNRGKLYNSLYELLGLRILKYRYIWKQRFEVYARLLVITDLFVGPPCRGR